jgi:hypothetical protein
VGLGWWSCTARPGLSLCADARSSAPDGACDIALVDLLATVPPGWHNESWSWDDEERDIRSRLCLCCGQPGHHQEQVEARIVAAGGVIEPVCIGDDGRLHDGHHRVVAAIKLGIDRIPLETRAEADARWGRDHGTHIPELRRFGDIPAGEHGEHWDWIQMIRQEARDFVAWEASRAA